MPEVNSFLCVKHVNWTILDNVNIVTLDSASDGKDPFTDIWYRINDIIAVRAQSLLSKIYPCSLLIIFFILLSTLM